MIAVGNAFQLVRGSHKNTKCRKKLKPRRASRRYDRFPNDGSVFGKGMVFLIDSWKCRKLEGFTPREGKKGRG